MVNSVFSAALFIAGCTFTVLVYTRESATRNMEKVQVIKVRTNFSFLGNVLLLNYVTLPLPTHTKLRFLQQDVIISKSHYYL